MYTTENFWCPRCGRLPLQMGQMYVEPGLIGSWTTITCRQCSGTDGDIVCRGDTGACVLLLDGFCRFHGNFIGEHPHPHGVKVSRERQEQAFVATTQGEATAVVTLAIVCFKRYDLLPAIVASAKSGTG